MLVSLLICVFSSPTSKCHTGGNFEYKGKVWNPLLFHAQMPHQMKPPISDFPSIRSIVLEMSLQHCMTKNCSRKRKMILWEGISDNVQSVITGDGASDEKFNFILPTHPLDCVKNFVATQHDKKTVVKKAECDSMGS